MNKFMLFIGFLLIQFTAISQIKLISTANGFEEPRNGYVKLLLLKNGNTAYVYTNDDGMQIKLYNAAYKEIVTKYHKFQNGPLRYGEMEACFEMGGKVIVLMNELKKDYTYRYKAEINAENAELISYESMDDLAKKYMGDDWSNLYKIKNMEQIYVFKDPNSEYYTVLCYANTTDDKQIYVAYILDKQNQIVKNSWYNLTPDKARIKYSYTVGYALNSNQAVYVVRNHELLRQEKFKDSELELIVLNNNKGAGVSKMIDVVEGEQPTDVLIKYNPVTRDLHIVTQVDLKNPAVTTGFFQMKTEYQKRYSVSHRIYNTEKHQLLLLPALDMADIDVQHRKSTEEHTAFRGVLQDFYVHSDGGYTFVLEGLKTTVKTHMSTNQAGMLKTNTSTLYNLGGVVSLRYSKDHQKQTSSLAIKEQMLNNSIIGGGAGVTASPLYHYSASMGSQRLKGGNQYKSFGFIPGNTKNYTLFNDLDENAERIAEKKELKVVKDVRECNGYYYEADVKTIMPARHILTPMGSKKDWQPYMFTVSDFNHTTGRYVTLKLSENRGNNIGLAWFQID